MGRGDRFLQVAAGTAGRSDARPFRTDSLFRIASMTKPIVAAGALLLAQRGRLALDDPIDPFLPELADRRVLVRLDAPLEETEPARRPLTARDLLTLTMGMGHLPAEAHAFPIRRALRERGILHGPPTPFLLPPTDAWLRRLADLPLMHHPGEHWMYDLGLDLLGALVERVVGEPLPRWLRENLLEPLGMRDTGFHVPADRLHRLPPAWVGAPGLTEELLYDPSAGGWSRPPAFASGGGGLVSSAEDLFRFHRFLLRGGIAESGERILEEERVGEMVRDHLTDAQRSEGAPFLEGQGWGLGIAVRREAGSGVSSSRFLSPGSFGWIGGLGTLGYADPEKDAVVLVLTQRMFGSPEGAREPFEEIMRRLPEISADDF